MDKRLTSLFHFIFYVLFIMVATVIFVVHGLALWLATDAGGDWVKNQIELVGRENGYDITLGDFSLKWMGISVSDVEVAEESDNGLTAQATDVGLTVNPFSLLVNSLTIGVSADTVTIIRYPAEENDSEPSEPFTLPDLFFSTINISADINRLRLPDEAPVFGIEIDQSISQDDDTKALTIGGDIDLSFPDIALAPRRIDNNLLLTNEGLTVTDAIVEHPLYSLLMQGRYGWDDNSLALTATGETSIPSYYEIDDLDDIEFQLGMDGSLDNFNGTLAVQSNYQDNDLFLNADLNGTNEAIRLSNISGLADQLAMSGNLAMPFETAPLVNGDIRFETSALSRLLGLAGVDLEINANAIVDIALSDASGEQGARLSGTVTDIVYDGMVVDQLAFNAFDENITDTAWPDLDLTVQNASAGATVINNADATISLRNTGGYGFDIMATGENIEPFTITAKGVLMETDPLSVILDSAVLNLAEGSANFSGRMRPDLLDMRLTGRNIAVSRLPFVEMPDLPVLIDSVNLKLSQTPSNPVMDGDFAVTTATADAPETVIYGTVEYRANRLSVNANGRGEGINRLDANAAVPLSISLYPFAFDMAGNAKIDGEIGADLDIGTILPFITEIPYSLNGNLIVDADIGGQIDNLSIAGQGQIADGQFYDPSTDLILNAIQGRFDFTENSIVINDLTATGEDENGTLRVSGDINIADPQYPDINLAIDAANIHIVQGPPYDIWLNADVSFTTEGTDYLLAGNLTLGEVIILLPETRAESIPQLNIVEPDAEQNPSFFERIRLDLTFVADNKIFVRGYGVDTEMAGELAVTGRAEDPQVNGDLSSIRGRYEDFGRQFTIQQAVLRFQGSVPPSPYLDIIASVRIDDVDAKVNIGGTPVDPSVGFSSQPPLPEDEVLSRILFGEDISTISPFQAIQLANTLRRLSGRGGGGLNILGSLRDATGLDDLRIEGSGADTKVGVGKYIGDKIYLDVSRGAGEDSGSARVDYELTPSLTLESEVRNTGESDTSIQWQWDY